MPITLITGPANSGKAGVALDALRAHRARGEHPLLLVPTAADVLRYRRELASDGPAPAARVERFDGLLAEVVRRAGDATPPLGRIACERALVAALSETTAERAPGAVRVDDSRRIAPRAVGPAPGGVRPAPRAARQAPGAERLAPGAVRALAALVAELDVERVTPVRLRAALTSWAGADPAQPVHAHLLGELFERRHDTLARLHLTGLTPERQATRALDALRRAPALWGATPVLLYGFDDFTRLQLDAIETLGAVVDAPLTVSLAYEPGRAAFAARGDTFQRLLPLAAEHRCLPPRADRYAPASAALHHLERYLFEPAAPPSVPAGKALRLLEGGDERAELELVAEGIGELLHRGVQPSEIAVAHRSPARIAELLSEVFRARTIPFALRRSLPFARTATGRALLGLLRAAFVQERDGDAADLLAWLRAPATPRHAEAADELELRMRRAGVRGVAAARALWEAEHAPLTTLDQLREAAQRSPAALIHLVAAELRRLDFAERMGAPANAPSTANAPSPANVPSTVDGTSADVAPTAASAPTNDADTRMDPRETLAGSHETPADLHETPAGPHETPTDPHDAAAVATRREARALAVAREALAELRDLAGTVPHLAPDPKGLIALLGDLEVVVEEGSEHDADAVAVLDPLALRARRVRALFLCGMHEGVFPAPARPEPYLSEEERRGLAEASGLRLGRPVDALARERYLLYAAVSRPWELLVLSWHTADDDGVPRARSLFVEDICDLFSDDLHGLRTRRALGELAALASAEAPSAPATIAPLRDPAVLAELDERRLWSASSLQAWAGCPVRWYVERLLHARDLEPEAEPLARGGLAHAALRQTFERLRSDTGSARLTTARLPHARELLQTALQEHADEHPLSTLPERVPAVRRRLEADLERYLEHAAECGDRAEAGGQLELDEPGGTTPLEPTRLELSFGFTEEGAPPPSEGGSADGAPGCAPQPDGAPGCGAADVAGRLPALDLGEGVAVRGYIDRVDLAPGGDAVVYDYKSGAPTPPDRWLDERSFQIALYSRAVEQLLGWPVAGGFYQPLAGRDLRARGLLAAGEGVTLACVRGDLRPPEEVRELMDEVIAAARAAALQARAGALEARPDTCGFGGGCMYPSICRCDR